MGEYKFKALELFRKVSKFYRSKADGKSEGIRILFVFDFFLFFFVFYWEGWVKKIILAFNIETFRILNFLFNFFNGF